MKRAPALILAGASGVGKNTVAEALLGMENSPFLYTRSLTTRAPRDTFTSEYLYVSESEFLSRVKAGKMLEYTCYGENYYGTPMSEIERAETEGKIPLMILDINGVESIRRDYPDFPIYAVYLYAEPVKIIDRLENRDHAENREGLQKRLENNREDFLSLAEGRMRLFDAFVENNTVEKAAKSTLLHYRENRLASEESLFAMRDFFLRAAKFIFK